MSLEGGLPPGPVPQAPAAGSTSQPAQRTPPGELDEFLARAVDRQIAEQRALRESLQELSTAIKELQSRPQPSAPSIDLADLDSRIRRAMEANSQMFSAQLREFSASILPEIARAGEGAKGSRAIEHDLSILRDGIGSLSADVEGIAQALIDLNAGLRDWAEGVDRNIDAVRGTVDHLRDVATRTEQLQSEAVQLQANAVAAAEERAAALAAAEERAAAQAAQATEAVHVAQTAAQSAAEVAVAEVVEQLPAIPDIPEVPVVEAAPVELAPPRDVTAEIEQRVKETIELSLYLADQIESFDKAIANLGDLPTRLEGVIAQALKRTLAARAKLDREAETALDEVVATLDEHIGHVGDLSATAEGVRDLAAGQQQIAVGLRALADAIDRSYEGRAPRAVSSISKSARRLAPDEDLPPAASARKKASTRKPAKSKTSKRTAKTRTSAASGRTPSAPGRTRRGSASRKPTGTDYIDIDAD